VVNTKAVLAMLALTFDLLWTSATSAKIVGQVVPPPSLSLSRVAQLPAPNRAKWQEYLRRSQLLQASDKTTLAGERAATGGAIATVPALGSPKSMPLDKPADWYRSDAARGIGDNIVSYQTPAGGWGKNQDRATLPRSPGQSYVEGDGWNYVGTIDNGATTTELAFLARMITALPPQQRGRLEASFVKGVRYLLAAQFPNGGWPQIYPLQGGYHDALTYNDDALARVVELLMGVASRRGYYGFVPARLAADADDAVRQATGVILSSQIRIAGARTGWGQQHDPVSLAPVGARNFEPASLSTAETATLLKLLMQMRQPDPRTAAAIHDGVAWLKSVALRDVEWRQKPGEDGKRLVAKAGAGPIWARFYDIRTMRPIFGDRDRSIHDDVNELSAERRNGYSWFGTAPARVLDMYRTWAILHPKESAARKR